jgi:hypothetical protein
MRAPSHLGALWCRLSDGCPDCDPDPICDDGRHGAEGQLSGSGADRMDPRKTRDPGAEAKESQAAQAGRVRSDNFGARSATTGRTGAFALQSEQ